MWQTDIPSFSMRFEGSGTDALPAQRTIDLMGRGRLDGCPHRPLYAGVIARHFVL
jgi:hypothetical protein